MADISQSSWSEVDGNNTQPIPDGFPTGVYPSQVKSWAQAVTGGLKRPYNRMNPTYLATTTASDVFTVALTQAPTAMPQFEAFRTRFITSNSGTGPTIVYGGFGPFLFKKYSNGSKVPLAAADIMPGRWHEWTYDGTNAVLNDPNSSGSGTTGSGAQVLQNSPTLVTPTLGAASATSINKMAITAPASGSTLAVADGKTATVSNTLTFAGTDGTTMTFPGASASVGYINIPVNPQTSSYTTVLSDAGKTILHPVSDNNTRTFTINSNVNVAYIVGTAISFVNDAASSLTITVSSDSLVLAGTGSTGARTLAQYGMATALKKTTSSWIIAGTGIS